MIYVGRYKWKDKNEKNEVYKCPIDRYIARSIYKIAPDGDDGRLERCLSWLVATSCKGFSWNKITVRQYEMLQAVIKKFCDKEGYCPLDFDLLYWENLEESELIKQITNDDEES